MDNHGTSSQRPERDLSSTIMDGFDRLHALKAYSMDEVEMMKQVLKDFIAQKVTIAALRVSENENAAQEILDLFKAITK